MKKVVKVVGLAVGAVGIGYAASILISKRIQSETSKCSRKNKDDFLEAYADLNSRVVLNELKIDKLNHELGIEQVAV